MQMLKPVTMQEIALSEGIKRQYVRIYQQITYAYKNKSLLSNDSIEEWVMSKLLLLNALHNNAYKLYATAAKHYGLTPEKEYKERRHWEEFKTEFDAPSYSDLYFNYAASQFRLARAEPDFKGLYRQNVGLKDYHEMVKARFNEKLNK